MGVVMMVLTIVYLLSMSSIAHTATYYLKPDTGLDSNNGAFSTPWKTMFKVKSSVTAGDTVRVIAGTYTSTQYKGEAGNPLWTQAHGLGTAGNVITITADSGPGTVTFDGEFTVYWMIFRAASAYNGHYIVVRDLTFHHFAGVAIGGGINGTMQSHHLAVINCTFQNFTSNQAGAISNNTFDRAIYLNNRFTNIGDPALGGDGLPDSQHAFYTSHDSHHVVHDGNYMEQISGFGIHAYGGFFGGGSGNLIVRRNTIVNTWSSSQIYAGDVFTNVYTYNNTMYNQQVPWAALGSNSANAMVSYHNGGTYTNIRTKNNISAGYVAQGMLWSDAGFAPTGLEMNYNMWQYVGGVGAMYKWLATTYTSVAAFQAATVYGDNDVSTDPLFVNIATRNFSLGAGSPAIDTGDFLTRAVGAGSSSTALTVTDAGFFHDGYGLVTGDTIKIGSAAVVGITAVNYTTNVITLSAARTWANTDGVSLAYNGAKPDLGALESGVSTAATKVKFGVQPVTTRVGNTLPSFTVQVQDVTNTLVATATDTISLAIAAGPAFLPGTTSLVTQLFNTGKVGRYVKLVALADNNGSNAASAAEITILNNSVPIAQGGMSVVSVNSQESSSCCGGPRLATHAIDGNTATYWYTQYTGGLLGPPYTLILDLGTTYTVNGWTYLPHQTGDPAGLVTKYEFYVSTDGTTWGTALTDAGVTGTVSKAATAGTAIFDNVMVSTIGGGYKFGASASGLTSDTSTAFDITTSATDPKVIIRFVPR